MSSGLDSVDNILKIGTFDVDGPRNRLVRNGQTYSLEPQVMNVLRVLAEKPGEVFSRETLINRIWNVEHGGDESLTRAVSILRKTFKKSGDDKSYLETIYKRGYRLNAPVLKALSKTKPEPKNSTPKKEISIAVLAFEDMSRNKDQEYFSDGISEEILNALVKLPFLRVTGRTSSFSFKGQSTSIREIAEILDVTHVLEGSVRKNGVQLRITVQLIDGSNDEHLWSETYDGTLGDIFDLQEEIARAAERELNSIFGVPNLTPPKNQTNILSKNTQAYDYFIHGRGLTQQRDGNDILPRAIELLEKAVSIDPEFAEAWAYLARANFYVLEHTKAPNWADNIAAGRRALARALTLNPNLALAHSTQGYLSLLDLKVDERLVACHKAFELNPNSPIFKYTFGSSLASIGQSERGLAFMEDAVSQEPLSASWINGLGHPKFALGDFEGADANYQQSHDLGYDGAMFMKAILLNHIGDSDGAIEFLSANFTRMGSLLTAMVPNSTILKLNFEASFGRNNVIRWLIYMMLRSKVMSNKTQPSVGLAIRCFFLGYPQLFMSFVRKHPHPYLGAALAQLWTPTLEAKMIRTHVEFPKFAEDIGLVRAWQAHGWPKHIQPIEGTDGSDGQFICT